MAEPRVLTLLEWGRLAARGAAPQGDDVVVRRQWPAQWTKATDDGLREMSARVSTGDLDADSDRLNPLGADLSRWKRYGSPLLFAHNYGEPAIGHGVESHSNEEGVFVRFKFARHERATTVWELLRDGMMTGFSVGFVPESFAPNPDGGYDIDRWTILEVSAVPVPANSFAHALAKARSLGLVAEPAEVDDAGESMDGFWEMIGLPAPRHAKAAAEMPPISPEAFRGLLIEAIGGEIDAQLRKHCGRLD